MAEEPRELTIVGGGLAGLSLGIALRRYGVGVVLHEATAYPRHRVCGEFISGLHGSTVETLGIEQALRDAVRHRSTIWYRRNQVVLEADLPEEALSLSRHLLDARLCRQLEDLGGTVHQAARFAPRSNTQEGLIWTHGRQATRESPWLGLKAHFTGFASEHGLEMHVGDGIYVGVAGVENDRTNVCALLRGPLDHKPKSAQGFSELMHRRGLPSLASRLREAEVDTASVIGVTALPFRRSSVVIKPRPIPDRCFLGDAYAQIPPFTGNGMTMAFQSAESALPHLEAYAHHKQDWTATCQAIQAALHERFGGRLQRAGWLHPLLTKRWGQSLLGWSGAFHNWPFRKLYHATR